MIGRVSDWILRYPGRLLQYDHMSLLGLERSMRTAKRYNRVRYRALMRRHRELWRTRADELLAGNGLARDPSTLPVIEDGYALDTSMSLPHLDALLAATDEIIAARDGVVCPDDEMQQRYFYQFLKPGHLERYPALLDFILSSEVLAVVGRHFGFVPLLSRTLLPGLRLMVSSNEGDGSGDGDDGALTGSQLYHLDHHDSPMVYVIVLLQDVTEACGPFTFLPASASERSAAALRYRKRGEPYRVTDERMYACVPENEAIVFTGAKGSVLFIDTSRCFHYGSRDAVVPRYQAMYAFTTPCRTDLTQTFREHYRYPTRDGDSELRRIVVSAS